jgi:hypothetical protein
MWFFSADHINTGIAGLIVPQNIPQVGPVPHTSVQLPFRTSSNQSFSNVIEPMRLLFNLFNDAISTIGFKN